MAPDTLERAVPALKDPSLLRMQCYVDGGWIDADDGATNAVANPATGRAIGTVPVCGAAETRARDRRPPTARGRRGATCSRRTAARSCASGTTSCSRTADDLALILTTEQGKPLAEAERRNRDRRRVRRMVRRGRQARLRRRDPDHRQRPPPGRGQAAGRRLRGDHAVEFPVLDDHAQGRAGAGRRLHRRDQAGGSDALLGVRARGAGASRRVSARRAQRADRRSRRRSAARCARTRRCASCRSPAPPRSAGC